MFIPATFAAIAPEPKPELPMRWSDVEAQLGVQFEAPTAESALRNIEGRDRLRASPAWQAGVVGTVEELDALEAAVKSQHVSYGDRTMDDVVRALLESWRETERAAFGAMPTVAEAREIFARERLERKRPQGPPDLVMSRDAMRDLLDQAPIEFIARPSKIRLRRRPERHE